MLYDGGFVLPTFSRAFRSESRPFVYTPQVFQQVVAAQCPEIQVRPLIILRYVLKMRDAGIVGRNFAALPRPDAEAIIEDRGHYAAMRHQNDVLIEMLVDQFF